MKEWRASGEPVLAEVGAPFMLSLDVAAYPGVRRTAASHQMPEGYADAIATEGTTELDRVATSVSA